MANLTHYRPFIPMRSLQREIDRLFGDYVPFFGENDTESAVWAPKVDMTETASEYVVTMEVPGIPKENIHVGLEDHRLTVTGERKDDTKKEDENRLVIERSYGSFYRSMSLPHAAGDKKVDAELRDGVLTITIQKAEESKPRRIAIK